MQTPLLQALQDRVLFFFRRHGRLTCLNQPWVTHQVFRGPPVRDYSAVGKASDRGSVTRSAFAARKDVGFAGGVPKFLHLLRFTEPRSAKAPRRDPGDSERVCNM